MSYSESHILVAWGGTMPGGETWVNSLRVRDLLTSGPLTHDNINTYLNGGIKDAILSYWNNVRSRINPAVALTWAKANRVDTAGRYTDDTTNRYDWSSPNAGGGNMVPNQLALTVSTTTGHSRGHAHGGRWYLPGFSGAPSSDGLLPADAATAIAGFSALFIHDINAAFQVLTVNFGTAAVFSKVGAGASHDITGVRVGRVIDTQRRRRRSQAESYVSAAVS